MYVVINRTSAEAKMGVSLHRAKLNERMLFSKSSWHCLGLPCGMEALCEGLKRIFRAYVQTQIPFLNEELRAMHTLQKSALLDLDTALISKQRQHLKSAVSVYQSVKNHALPSKAPYFSITGNLGVSLTIFRSERKILLKKLKEGYHRKSGKALAIKHGLSYHKIQNLSEFDCYPNLNITRGCEDPSIHAWVRAHDRLHKIEGIPRTLPSGLVEALFYQQTTKWKEHLNSFLEIVEANFSNAVCSSITQACVGIISSSVLVDRASRKINECMKTLRESCHKKLDEVRENPAQYVNEDLILNKIEIARKRRAEDELSGLNIDSWASTGYLTAFAFTFEHGAKPQYDWKQNSTSVVTQRTINEIHDILQAYCELAAFYISETVCTDVFARVFVEEIMTYFSNEFVDNLADADVKFICAEPPEHQEMKKLLENQLRRLEASLTASKTLMADTIAG